MSDLAKKIHSSIEELRPQIKDAFNQHFSIDHLASFTGFDAQDITNPLDLEMTRLFVERMSSIDPRIIVDSEENSLRGSKDEVILRIDPVDGSKHFYAGIKEVSVCISLVEEGVVTLGIVYHPFLDDFYSAHSSQSTLNDKPISVNQARLEKSIIYIEEPVRANNSQSDFFDKIKESCFRTRNLGLWSLSATRVAQGSAAAFFDFSGTTKVYDIEAAILIAQCAGAVCGCLDGEIIETLDTKTLLDTTNRSRPLFVANPESYEQIKDFISNEFK
jgi:fructose-1,6-bisphosphatase/inositol monophosphatase family enzyme